MRYEQRHLGGGGGGEQMFIIIVILNNEMLEYNFSMYTEIIISWNHLLYTCSGKSQIKFSSKN
jgi:hypothetical protein